MVSLAFRFFFGNGMNATVVTRASAVTRDLPAAERPVRRRIVSAMTADRLLVGLDADQRRAVESDAAAAGDRRRRRVGQDHRADPADRLSHRSRARPTRDTSSR